MTLPRRAPACIVTHGGAANDPGCSDGCALACAAGLDALRTGDGARAAAVAAVVVLEDDPRMNAGTGATLRLDGRVQLDASVMDQDGFGAVAALVDVKNPVRAAAAVYELPHLMLVGEGANLLAQSLGLEPALPITAAQRDRHAARLARLSSPGGDPAAAALWQGRDPRALMNDPAGFWRAVVDVGGACDTVGAVVRTADGRFAAAASTGGVWCALHGRVGDVPIPGAGLYVGRYGAVAATGVGEIIWRDMMAKEVYDLLARGRTAQEAVSAVVERARYAHPGHDVGFICVDEHSAGAAVTAQMPWAVAAE